MSNYEIQQENFDTLSRDTSIVIVRSEFNSEYTKALENINVEYLKEQ
jgi:6,7-dimethyl-8-ribityllumazine synthase